MPAEFRYQPDNANDTVAQVHPQSVGTLLTRLLIISLELLDQLLDQV